MNHLPVPPLVPNRLRRKSIAQIDRGKPPLLSQIGLALAGVVFCVVAVAVLSLVAASIANYTQSCSWEATPCEITSSHVVEDNSRNFLPVISYTYSFQGKAFASSLFEPKKHLETVSSRAKAKEIVDRYPTGKKLTCFVNPDAPSEVCLERAFPWVSVLSLFFPVFFFGGGFLLLSASGIFLRKTKAATSASTAVPSGPSPKSYSSTRVWVGVWTMAARMRAGGTAVSIAKARR
jgi:hypothetical protein